MRPVSCVVSSPTTQSLCAGNLSLWFVCGRYAASATVPPCLTAIVSSYGTGQQKGTVIGIFRSLGALARAFGPVVASVGTLTPLHSVPSVMHS